MMTDQRVSAGALAVLRAMECDCDRARITSGQLDRSLYEEVNEVLARLGGKWKGGRTRAHLFPYDPRPLLAGVIATGDMPPKNPTAFFPTPPSLVASVMESPLWNTIRDGDAVLEPSAGFGALAEGVRRRLTHRQVQIDCCEILPINQQVLRSKGFEIVCDDFLTYQPEKRYQAVVMNPPFSVEEDRLAYITHIRHAWDLLADGGFLIAFAPSGYTFRTDKKSYDFLSFVLTSGWWEELPPKSFHESGTDSVITLMTLEKQDISWKYRPQGAYSSWFCREIILHADSYEEFLPDRDRLVTQLDCGALCSNPREPDWSRTRAAIHEYYQGVIAHARKHGQHFDIRTQDWPCLEQYLMRWWNDEWEADGHQNEEVPEAFVQESPIVVKDSCGPAKPMDVPPASLDHEVLIDRTVSITPIEGAAVERVASSIRTPLYSPLPGDASLSYEQLYEHYKQMHVESRASYPALPWRMEELAGTIWRNIHTGEAQMVHHIGTNCFGKLALYAAPASSIGLDGQDLEIIGFWSGDRYVVEHWVRVDHQCQEAQLRWFGIELAWLRGQIIFCDGKIAEYRRNTANRSLHRRMKQEYQLQLQAAEARMYEFAARHDLSIPVDVLNRGIAGSRRDPVQMVLF